MILLNTNVSYHFQNGYTVKHHLIKLSSGVIIRPEGNQRQSFDWRFNTPVVVSWISSGFYPRLVDIDAVEKKRQWARMSTYQRKFFKDPCRSGFIVEEKLRLKLLSAGIRAEPATDFEDEMLKVDMWLFLKMHECGWVWVPVNVTLNGDIDHFQTDPKYQHCFKKGVVAVQLNSVEIDDVKLKLFFQGMQKGMDDFDRYGKDLLDRSEARELEIAKYGGRQMTLGERVGWKT